MATLAAVPSLKRKSAIEATTSKRPRQEVDPAAPPESLAFRGTTSNVVVEAALVDVGLSCSNDEEEEDSGEGVKSEAPSLSLPPQEDAQEVPPTPEQSGNYVVDLYHPVKLGIDFGGEHFFDPDFEAYLNCQSNFGALCLGFIGDMIAGQCRTHLTNCFRNQQMDLVDLRAKSTESERRILQAKLRMSDAEAMLKLARSQKDELQAEVSVLTRQLTMAKVEIVGARRAGASDFTRSRPFINAMGKEFF